MSSEFEVDVAKQHVIFLAGIGQSADAWEPIIAGLSNRYRGLAFAVSDLIKLDEPFTIAGSIGGLHQKINNTGADDVVLCGLSLGAMIAITYTIAHPERVTGLVVAGAQVRPSPAIMAMEQALVRVLPASFLGMPPELSKSKLSEIIGVVARIDLRNSLNDIEVPTLAICGAKDRANLKAARVIAEGIDGASLAIVKDGGHELNVDKPVEFGSVLAEFLDSLPKPG